MAVYKTVVTVTVLSDYELPDGVTLEEIAAEADDGSMICGCDWGETERVPANQVHQELLAVGNDGSFFGDDDDDATHVACRFIPQVWINDWATGADPEGPETFHVPIETVKAIARHRLQGGCQRQHVEWDELKSHAPRWARHWRGPFEIVIDTAVADEVFEEVEQELGRSCEGGA